MLTCAFSLKYLKSILCKFNAFLLKKSASGYKNLQNLQEVKYKRTKHISLKTLRYNKQFCKGGKITSPIEIIY